MNEERKCLIANAKINHRLITDISFEKYLGYFPLANILNTLDVEEHFTYRQSTRDFQFKVFSAFSSLVFARAVAPLSKYRTFHDVLPSLLNTMEFSYDQLLAAVEFIGSEYEKFVEIFTVATFENYALLKLKSLIKAYPSTLIIPSSIVNEVTRELLFNK